MNFTGTVLVDTSVAVKHNRNLATTIKTEGKVKKELDFHGRQVFFGTGKIIVDGGWHALQWFGRDMTAKCNGYGVFRLNGEFDKNLNNGYFLYYDASQKKDWVTGGNQPTVPESTFKMTPKVKINGKASG